MDNLLKDLDTGKSKVMRKKRDFKIGKNPVVNSAIAPCPLGLHLNEIKQKPLKM